MKAPTAIITATALAVSALATPALAGTQTARVSYADLNLTTQEGQDTLQKRLNKAAWRVCMFDDKGQVQPAEKHSACYHASRKDVDVQFAEVVADHRLGG